MPKERKKKGPYSQSYCFSSSHVWMWELGYKESWAPKNWCFWTVVSEKTLDNPWSTRRSKQSILKEISPDCSLEGLMLKLKLQYFDVKSWHIGKDPDTGKDWGQEEKGMTEDEMVGWHHRHYGHEFKQAPGVGDGQGTLTCCSPLGHKESDTTEQLNWYSIQYSHLEQNFPLQCPLEIQFMTKLICNRSIIFPEIISLKLYIMYINWKKSESLSH